METKPFNLGILGGALHSIAGYPHFIASQMDARFKVVSGVFSTNPKLNKATAEYWKIERFYNSIDEFIEKEKGKLDAVSVLLPTPLHYEVVKKLLYNGFAVICEKPLFATLEEIEKLPKDVNLENKFLVVTYNYIAYPLLGILRERILQGDFGEILNIHLEMPQESFLRPPKGVKDYPPKWRKKDGPIPGILLDLMSHLFSLMKFLTEKSIKKVYSQCKSFNSFGVVDEVKVIAEFTDKTVGFFWVSKSALGNRNGLKVSIYGTKASALWVQEDPEKVYVSYADGKKCIWDRSNVEFPLSKRKLYNRMTPGHPAGFIEAFANLYWDIAEALKIFKMGEDYKKISPLIWTYEREKENFTFLSSVVKSAKENREVLVYG
jgi:predicted dehydrogenase